MSEDEKHSTVGRVENSTNLEDDAPNEKNNSPLAWLLPLILLGLLLTLGYWYCSSSAA